MKILNFSDMHLSDSKPRRRTDNYQKTQLTKLRWILDLAENEGTIVTCSGDLLDKPVVSENMKVWLFYNLVHPIIMCYGQHETINYRFNSNCSLFLLNEIGKISAVGRGGFIDVNIFQSPQVHISTSSWGQSIPEVRNKDRFNILLAHKLLSDKDYWSGHVEYCDAKSFLKKNSDYDLIFTGDNHKTFFVEHKGRTLINCGSVMRSNIDQVDHRPLCVIYDTDTRTFKKHYIPIEPAEKIFNLEFIQEEKIINEKLAGFIDEIKRLHPKLGSKEDEIQFKQILTNRMKDLPESVQQFIVEASRE